MFIGNAKDMPKIEMTIPGANGAFKQVAVGPAEGWQGYVMRIMTLAVGGNSPQHRHPWPHINYVIAGEGIIFLDGEEYPIQAGACAYLPVDSEHGFRNTGKEELQFICIVPEEGEF